MNYPIGLWFVLLRGFEPLLAVAELFCPRQVRLIDAGFIWTEPHSKRLKLKLTVQKEVACGLGKAFRTHSMVLFMFF